MSSATTLRPGLKQRHLSMIAIGGVVGAGLFVGSGTVINGVGPAAFLSYAATGILIVLVMRMLGEMAVAEPSAGSFSDYAERSLGRWASFSVGWLYWYFWVIVVGFEAVAGAAILQRWLPGVPLWIMALGLLVLMTATNLFSVRSYGEFEYWFSTIKVACILVFILAGLAFVLGLWPGRHADFSNLTAHGGFMPHGFGSIASGIAIVVFSMVGAEIATIAAAESAEPERAVVRATNSVIFRVATFYVGSVFLLVVILPWNSQSVLSSPFVTAFDAMGVPAAAQVMNFVVLTAVLSCLNSGLYTASRMLFMLSTKGQAPASVSAVTQRGVPARAILLSTIIGFVSVIAAYTSPDKVFLFLLNSSGAVILFVYLLICCSELVMRRRLEREAPERLIVKMWFYPALPILAAAAIIGILISMYVDSSTRVQILCSLASWGLVLVAYAALRGRISARAAGAVPSTPVAELS
ncbi:amino acid permease [Nocardioides maradonensis]